MASVTILHHGRREKVAVDASKPLVSVEAAVPTTATGAIVAPSYLGRRLFQPSMQLAAVDAYCSKVGLDVSAGIRQEHSSAMKSNPLYPLCRAPPSVLHHIRYFMFAKRFGANSPANILLR